MNWLDKLERKYHRYAIPHITRYMILANIIGYVLYYASTYMRKDFLSPMAFSVSSILHGQIWRLVTWIFIPTNQFSMITMLFIFCLLMLGENLEYYIGSFRMTVYFLGAVLLNDIGGIIVYLLVGSSPYLTLYYTLFSMYLMLGLFMPDAEVRLYFVLPIKMKYMIFVYAIFYVIDLVSFFRMGFRMGLCLAAPMIISVVNLLLFVAACKRRRSPFEAAKQRARQQQFQRAARPTRPAGYPNAGGAGHKCVICGRTEKTNPELTFRYCSKCSGAKEYCNDHLFTHTHN